MTAGFSDYVRHLAEAQSLSIAALQDMLGWPYAKARSVKVGTLHPSRVSLQDAVALSDILGVSVDELAEAARYK